MKVRMTYCNMETEELRYFVSTHSRAELEEWFIGILEEYKKWADFSSQWQDISLEEKINRLIQMAVHSRQHHFFVMTQEEELWVHKHLSPEDFDIYQQGQVQFYEQLLSLWHIPEEKCTPKELGNLLLTVVLIYNSAVRSLPFFFPEELERTAQAQAAALSRYLSSLV